jgi:hypothetical protein
MATVASNLKAENELLDNRKAGTEMTLEESCTLHVPAHNRQRPTQFLKPLENLWPAEAKGLSHEESRRGK